MTQPSGNQTISHQNLVANEERFRALVTATSDVVYSMSPDWLVMRQLDGRGFLLDTHEPLVNWIPKYVHPGDQQKVNATIADAIKHKKIFQLEHRVVRADGTVGWTISRAVPILDDKGEITEWFGAASDITDRKRVEAALRDAKEESDLLKRTYETITGGTPDLMYVFDLEYRFTYANQALLTMWGKTWDNAIGKGLRENGYEEWHATMHEREIDQIRATKKPLRGEVSFPHAVLGRRVYDYILIPVINSQGEVEAVAGTTRDITDIKNAEIAISESEARFRTMAESTDVMIAVGDELGNAIYFNEAWINITARTLEELLKNGWLDLLHPDDRALVTKVTTEALREKNSVQFEFRIADNRGGYSWLLNRATPRFHQDGSFVGFVSSTIDITGIKENEQRKNDFISMVSHELKTPLTSAISYVQVSQKKAAEYDDALTAGMLDRAGVQLRKMTGMINGFLNVSRLESGMIHMERELFDLALLVKEAGTEAATTFTGHHLHFSPSAEIMVNADREKIGQVINNLISNAEKYSAPGTSIHIACNTVDGRAQVSVSDEGIGISPEDLPRLFERFYRVKANDTKHIAGFGIGLYICSEIIKALGGEIWATSTPGKGSTFYFSLPLSRS